MRNRERTLQRRESGTRFSDATIVRVRIVDGVSPIDGHDEEPAPNVAAFVAGHRVRVEVVREHSETTVGDRLLSPLATSGPTRS